MVVTKAPKPDYEETKCRIRCEHVVRVLGREYQCDDECGGYTGHAGPHVCPDHDGGSA